MRAGDREAREMARQQIDAAKIALGERGKPWWADGAPDFNRRMAEDTPYADWFRSLAVHGERPGKQSRLGKLVRTAQAQKADSPHQNED